MSVKKVLLAEDDVDDRTLFRAFLQQRPDIYIMPIAENGIILLDILEMTTESAQLPDFIILDQNMPKCSGLQTLCLLKKSERYSHIPVFIYSTYPDDKLKAECIINGAAEIVDKPISEAGYNTMIEKFLRIACCP